MPDASHPSRAMPSLWGRKSYRRPGVHPVRQAAMIADDLRIAATELPRLALYIALAAVALRSRATWWVGRGK